MSPLHWLIVVTVLISAVHSTLFHEEEGNNGSTSVHIALVLPENLSPEIIHGAVETVKVINKDDNVLQDIHLELVYPRIWTTFVETESVGLYNITALIGLFQLSEVQAHYPLAVASRLNIPLLLSGSPDPRVFNNDKYPDLFHLVQPTTQIIRVIFNFLGTHGWNRFGVIVDTLDHQNFDTVGQFQLVSHQNSSLAIKFYSITMQRDVKYILHKLETHISVVAVSRSNTFEFLCEAYLKGQVWPRFVWIVAYHRVEDIVSYAPLSDHARGCKAETIVEGVIFVHQQLLPAKKNTILVSGLTYKQLVHDVYNSTLDSPFNAYRNILHDALWTTALALNASMKCDNWTLDASIANTLHSHLPRATLNRVSFSGATGLVQFSQSNRERVDVETIIFQIINGTKLPLKKETSHFDKVGLNSTSLSKPSTRLIVFYLSNATCFIFVTVVLVLYCYYRKKDSIKSTSFSLSIMIFIGCYLILLYVVFSDMYYLPQYDILKASANYRKIECLARIWLHALGIPSIFIFATLMVKIARVYYIFLSPQKLKFSSNTALFIYVMLLMIPNVIVLIAWTVDTATHGNGLVGCTGAQSLFLWIYLVAAYFVALLLALVIVAILTRKIRYRNFKDTKKVNVLVLLLIYTYTFTLSCWMLLRLVDRNEQRISRIVLHVGHILVVVECIGLLFVPKVYPFLKEAVLSKVNSVIQ